MKATYRFLRKIMPLCLQPRMDILARNFLSILSRAFFRWRAIRPIRISQRPWPKSVPLLSVIIPSRNHGRSISDTLSSVLNQTFPNYEVWIIDSSTDEETIRLLQVIHHPKVQILFRPNDSRPMEENRRYGISAAKGKYICCLDPGGRLKPSYFEKGLYLAEIGGYDVVSCGFQECRGGSVVWIPPRRPDPFRPPAQNLMADCAIFSATAWKKVMNSRVRQESETRPNENEAIWPRFLASQARVINVQEPLFFPGAETIHPIRKQCVVDEDRQNGISGKSKMKCLMTKLGVCIGNDRILVENGEMNLYPEGPTRLDSHHVLLALPFLTAGGACKRFLEIAKLLARNGYHLFLVTTIPILPEQADSSPGFETLTGELFHLPLFLGKDFDWQSFVIAFIRQKKIGTVLLGGSQFFYNLLPVLKNAYPDLWVIDQQFNTSVHFLNNRRYAQYIDHTVAENRMILDKLLKDYQESPEKLSLIFNGVDVYGAFCPRPKDPSFQHSRHIPTDKVIISYIGRISAEKGPDLFLAIAEHFKKCPDSCFILAGPGMPEDADSCRKRISRLGLSDTVLFFNEYVDSRQFLSFSDIVVIPSRLDGRPNLLLEAMSMGKPVVASKAGAMPEIIEHRKTGLLCDIENIPHFVTAIGELMSNPAMRSDLGKNAREYALNFLDDSILLQKYLAIFSEGLSRNPGDHP